jgi:hypothetical protein
MAPNSPRRTKLAFSKGRPRTRESDCGLSSDGTLALGLCTVMQTHPSLTFRLSMISDDISFPGATGHKPRGAAHPAQHRPDRDHAFSDLERQGGQRPSGDRGLAFPDFSKPPIQGNEDLQANLIMPEPTVFLSQSFPVCSIIHPTETQQAATRAVASLKAMGLFIGQSDAFFATLNDLATKADMAFRA